MKKRKKVLLIDQMNLFIRCFSSLPFTNDKGEHVGAIYGCLNSFSSLMHKYNPDIVFIAWEGKGSAERRRKTLAAYKEGRKFTGFNRAVFGDDGNMERKSFRDQIIRVKEYIHALPFFQASVPFLEADDVIAYAVGHMFNDDEQFENIIVSTDRDYYQLVDDNTKIHRPVKTKKNKNGEFIDLNWVIEETGCHPKNYIISKCICGDGSDMVEGIPRVGQKTVAKDFPCLSTLKRDGDIYNIQDIINISTDKVEIEKSKKYTKYIENGDLLKRNHELMQLLDPDISLASSQEIEGTFTNIVPKFKNTQFRIMLLQDDMSPQDNTLMRWVDGFSNIKPKPIRFE
jgi:DNA polymerase I